MARTKTQTDNPPVLVTEADTAGLPAMTEAANVLAAVEMAYSDDRDLLNQLLGQAQMADAFSQFSRTVRTTKLAFVKEHKLYRALKGKKTPNRSEIMSGTWEEFCGLLGSSVDLVDLDISNLHAFGEEALESMSRMGIGYRELRAYRRLPDDDKTALLEAAKTGDRECFLDLAEDLIAKHAKEKAEAAAQAEETAATLEARDRRMEDQAQSITRLNEQVVKLERRVTAMTPVDIGEQIRTEAVAAVSQAEVGIRALAPFFTALAEHSDAHGITHDDFSAGLVCQLELALRQLRGAFDIKDAPDGEVVPAWLREEAPVLVHGEPSQD